MTIRRFAAAVCGLIVLVAAAERASASDWARFRGPNGSGVSPDKASIPASFGPNENLKWKVALPGPGSSSPIIVGDKVFVTCWSGYGVDRGNLGEQKDLKRHLVCLDRATGKTLWSQAVPAKLPEDRYGGMFAENGYASHTPASDGKHIYVFFGKSGVFCFDLDGKQIWQADVGQDSDRRGWGTASSPILFDDLVIVTASIESNALVALDKATGKQVWRERANNFESTWGTPVLVKVDDQRTDLVIGVPYEIWAFNPKTGKFAWYCPAMETDSFCSSVVADGDTVIGIEGRGGGSIAVRAGGKDDVSKTNIVWQGRDTNRIGTPVVYEGRVYFVANKIANCIDAKTGKKIFQARLSSDSTSNSAGGAQAAVESRDEVRGGGQGQGDGQGDRGPREQPRGDRGAPRGPGGGFGGPPGGGPPGGGFGGGRFGGGGRGGQDYSSPIIADGKLYYVARSGDVFVIKAGDTFEQLSVNRLTTESEDFSSSPAAADGALFIRSSKHLYCVAK
jgi:outer membrane protein assembly factor BamB